MALKSKIILLILILSFTSYYIEFGIGEENFLLIPTRAAILGGILWWSYLLSKIIFVKIPESFYKSSWAGLLTITPIIISLFILLIYATIFDSIKNYHYNNYGKETLESLLMKKSIILM
jgi:hypothetical protein